MTFLIEASSVAYLDLNVCEFRINEDVTSLEELDLSFAAPRTRSYAPPGQYLQVFGKTNQELPSENLAASRSFIHDVDRYMLQKLEAKFETEILRSYMSFLKAYCRYMNEYLFVLTKFSVSFWGILKRRYRYEKAEVFNFNALHMLSRAEKLKKLLFLNNCTDSNLVLEFIRTVCISLHLNTCVFFEGDLQVTDYLLYHLKKTDYNINDWMKKLFPCYRIHECIRSSPRYLSLLLNYGFNIFNESWYLKCIAILNYLLEGTMLPPLYLHQFFETLNLQQMGFKREVLVIQLFYALVDPDNTTIPSCLQSLCFLWRSIPDTFVTHGEMRRVALKLYGSVSNMDINERIEEVCDKFQKCGFDGCDAVPQPRSLSHYSRCVIRDALGRNSQLPEGFSLLGLPNHLQSYLRLEY